ncbi:MAG: hypothetical protein K0R47_1481 [Brevibacillus sp.]|nr:hypothetical protein [Brevibacillus sp.]
MTRHCIRKGLLPVRCGVILFLYPLSSGCSSETGSADASFTVTLGACHAKKPSLHAVLDDGFFSLTIPFRLGSYKRRNVFSDLLGDLPLDVVTDVWVTLELGMGDSCL